MSRENWLAKIAAALEAAKGTDFLVIARTECKLEYGIDEAIARCKAAEEMAAEMGVEVMTLIIGLKKIEEAEKVSKVITGMKMWPDVMSKNGKPDIDLADVIPYGFNFVTCHVFEKASMYGMYLYGTETLKARNTVFHDDHDMGIPADQAAGWAADMNLNYYIGIEKEFNDLADKYNKKVEEEDK